VYSCRRRLRRFSKIELASNKDLSSSRPPVTRFAGVREATRTVASVVDAGFTRKVSMLRLNVGRVTAEFQKQAFAEQVG